MALHGAVTLGAMLLLLALLSGCSAATTDAVRPSYASPADSPVPAPPSYARVAAGQAKKPAGPAPGAPAPAPVGSDVVTYSGPVAKPEEVAAAATQFSLDVAKHVFRHVEGNTVVSPLGVAHMLSLLQQAVDPLSEAAAQLERGLHLDRESSIRGLPHLMKNAVTKRKSKSVLESGGNLFVKSDWRPKEAFLNVARSAYNMDVTSLDFKQGDQAVAAINKWASDATHGYIPALLSRGSLTPDTSLVLASATYFRGVWKRMFDLGKTEMKLFSASPSRNVTVSMMYQAGDFRTGELPDVEAQWLELPFDGEHFSMLLVLPYHRHGLPEVLQRLDHHHVQAMLGQGPGRRAVLFMPRFRLSTNVGLSRTLQSLNMGALFSRDARLRGISDEPLTVSDVVHKAEMKVDEHGATASAASAVLVNTLSLVTMDDSRFYADHPFLAIIVDRTTKVPLFVGRVSNPIEDF